MPPFRPLNRGNSIEILMKNAFTADACLEEAVLRVKITSYVGQNFQP